MPREEKRRVMYRIWAPACRAALVACTVQSIGRVLCLEGRVLWAFNPAALSSLVFWVSFVCNLILITWRFTHPLCLPRPSPSGWSVNLVPDWDGMGSATSSHTHFSRGSTGTTCGRPNRPTSRSTPVLLTPETLNSWRTTTPWGVRIPYVVWARVQGNLPKTYCSCFIP